MDNTFKYKVTNFDSKTKLVDVEFDDGAWARIQLTDPLPQSLDDLNKIVQTYAPSLEAAQATQDSSADLTFLTSAVKKATSITSGRFSLAASAANQPQPFTKPLITLADHVDDLKARVATIRYNRSVMGVQLSDAYAPGGQIMDTDQESQHLIASKFLGVMAGVFTGNILWKCRSGVFITITPDEFKFIATQIATYVQSMFDWEASIDAQIAQAPDVDSLEVIRTRVDIPYPMSVVGTPPPAAPK